MEPGKTCRALHGISLVGDNLLAGFAWKGASRARVRVDTRADKKDDNKNAGKRRVVEQGIKGRWPVKEEGGCLLMTGDQQAAMKKPTETSGLSPGHRVSRHHEEVGNHFAGVVGLLELPN